MTVHYFAYGSDLLAERLVARCPSARPLGVVSVSGWRLAFQSKAFDGSGKATLIAGEASDVDAVIEAKGLKQMNDLGALEKIVDEVIAANAKSVDEFRAGKDKAFNALVGQVMKASKGKANPAQAGELLKKRLAG